jgi:nucleoid-associated protein YgaU
MSLAGAGASAGSAAGAAGGMAASAVSAYIQCIDLPMPPINFSYNPEGYTVVTEGKWKESPQPATNGSRPQWQGVVPSKMDIKILLDAFSVPPVPPSAVIDQLKLLVIPTALSMGTGASTAPTVMFGWGPNIIMDQAIVTKVSVAYERFLLGVPVRATATVSLSAVPLPAPLGPTNPSSGGLATRRTHTMVEGDSLASIATREYRDPNKWRALAEANNIDDPMRVKPGTVLIVPDRRDAEGLS